MVLTHNDLKVTETAFGLGRLPAEWDGVRVMQLSDLHFYEYSSSEFYENVSRRIKALSPDLIVITGDMVHFGNRHLDKVEAFLSSFDAPYGKFGILGNHDYYDQAQGQNVSRTLENSGVAVLVNDARRLERSGQPLWIAGIDDLWCGMPDIGKALETVPGNDCVLMLGHNPLLFDPVSSYGRRPVDMLLAGHTHGGHVFIPVLGPIYRHVLKMKYRYHHHRTPYRPVSPEREVQTQLYVTSGVGSAAFYWKGKKRQFGFPRFRYNTHPELVVHTFRSEN